MSVRVLLVGLGNRGTQWSRIVAVHPEAILAPETDDERAGTVPNVVFPTAVEEVEGVRYVFYGMADSKIGVARLDHT